MPHLFPNLFPPPEIWDKIPPLSDPARRRGIRREASILGVCGLMLASAAVVATIEYRKAFDKPEWTTQTTNPVAKNCLVKSIARLDGSVVIQIAHDAPPAGTKTVVDEYGPIRNERTVTSSGQLGLYGSGLGELHYGTPTDEKEFTFDPAGLPNGSHSYNITLQHGYEQVRRVGPLDITEPIKSSSFTQCGGIIVEKQQGTLTSVGLPG